MSIQQNFPAISPSLSLNFARSKKLDPRVTFTRTSSATRINETGLVEVVPANSPRFDHSYDPVSGTVKSLGLLVEEQRQNLLTYSEQFDNVTWTKLRASIIENVALSPNGTITADKLVEDTSTNTHLISKDISSTSGTYTYTVYVKSAERNIVQVDISDGLTAAVGGVFNLSTEFFSVFTGGSWSNVSASITNIGNGWFRCSATGTQGAGSVVRPRISLYTTGVSYQGDGTSGVYIWGAQLEQGSFPTSYIPTAATTATRTADNASITGTNFSDWYNQSEGTIFCSANNNPGITTSTSRFFYAFERSDGLSVDFIRKWIWNGNTGLLLNSVYTTNNGLIAAEFGTTLEEVNKRTAIAYKQNDFARSYNGSVPTTDNVGNISVGINQVRIGTNLSGHISQLTYYSKRLTNDQLINLTK